MAVKKRGRPKKSESVGASEKTKLALMESAKSLFAHKGYEGTTVKDIALQADVNVSLISYYFAGKEGLYNACVANHGDERLEMVQRVLKPAKSVDEFRLRLEMFLEEVFLGYLHEPELTVMALREAELMSEVVTDAFKKSYVQFFVAIVDYMKRAKTKGIIRKDVEPQIAAGILFSVINHYIRLDEIRETYFQFTIKNEDYRAKVIEQASAIFMNGLLK